MTKHDARTTVQISDEQARERLRQERDTFDQHKSHEDRWFVLQLVMGYAAVVIVPSIIIICVLVFVNHTVLPTAVVVSASGALFVDVFALVVAVWKIVLNKDFVTRLAPLTQIPSVSAVSESTLNETVEDKVESEKITILSAKYGEGENTNDVTEIIKAIVAAAAGRVHFTVNNETLGGDPYKGVVKDLRLVYSYAGETRTITVREREELSLP